MRKSSSGSHNGEGSSEVAAAVGSNKEEVRGKGDAGYDYW